MSSKIKHISKERVEASQKKLEEMLMKDPHGKEFLEQIRKLEKRTKRKLERDYNQRKKGEGKNEP